MFSFKSRPFLSIIVIVYNMQREAPRTLHSLSASYQRDVNESDYEVIVVENGSSAPLNGADIAQYGRNFRYIYIQDASPSPAAAINFGVARSKAANVGIMIDGARIASPGVISMATQCLSGFKKPVVATLGFHLGPDIQTRSVKRGYNQQVEDSLLKEYKWRENGYALFKCSALAGSSSNGWFGPINESNLIFLRKSFFRELGGYDERFNIPGGGLVNLDFYQRVSAPTDINLIMLLGEGTFHQFHGGTITNQNEENVPKIINTYKEDYREIKGKEHKTLKRIPLVYGNSNSDSLHWLKKSAELIEKYSERQYRLNN